MSDFDAIVVGGGHAGIEAALALARLGRRTILITQNPDSIGRTSCNPAIGGLAKGNLVREIDALGGQMAILTEASSLQVRMLNKSRGAAVQAPRAQIDKALYSSLARQCLEAQKGLSILMDTVVDFILDRSGKKIEGVITERGSRIGAPVLVLTTGTFMEAKLFMGDWRASGGRLGEGAALGLGVALRRRGFPVGRMKTGTPPRIDKHSVDFSSLEEQCGDDSSIRFSFVGKRPPRPGLCCWTTWTNEKTHAAIRSGLDHSPLFSGAIEGKGPRYCPSIEDKVVRFPDRTRHQIFLEPEGESSSELYVNGCSSSLSEDVQRKFLITIPGLSDVVLVRPGYAVEYDYLDPSYLFASLQSKLLAGLFVAGQTNGTSGYEEAAAQGLIAGINASRYLDNVPPLVLARNEAYIGVLIDDLVTLAPKEPYRMFTSRAEHRLALRQDSADLRVTPMGLAMGLADAMRIHTFEARKKGIDDISQLLEARKIVHADTTIIPSLRAHIGESLSLSLRDPGVAAAMDTAPSVSEFVAPFMPAHAQMPENWPEDWLVTALLDAHYAGYVVKEERLAARLGKADRLRIPADFDYAMITGLSQESREKLSALRPLTLGQASRIPGVRKSDAALLFVMLSRS